MIFFFFKVSVAFAARLLGYDKLKELLVAVIRPLVAGRDAIRNFLSGYGHKFCFACCFFTQTSHASLTICERVPDTKQNLH